MRQTMTTKRVLVLKVGDRTSHHRKGVKAERWARSGGIAQRPRHQAAIAPARMRPARAPHVMMGGVRLD